MDFYNAMHGQNDRTRVAEPSTVDVVISTSPVPAKDEANFLSYQFDSKERSVEARPIPPEEKPAPKKLKDAISKRTDSPAVRYINMVNRQ